MRNVIKSITTIAALTFLSVTAEADPVGGPQQADGLLYPGQAYQYTVPCRANETTVFRASGTGNESDLDCYLYDENGNLIDQDIDSTNTCLVSVNPRWTGVFYWKLVNNGSEMTYYITRAY